MSKKKSTLKIEKVSALNNRTLRTDEKLEDLGRSSYEILKEFIEAGDKKEALKLLDYVQHEFKWLHDLYVDWAYSDLDYIANTYGEEELEKFLRYAKNKLDMVAYKGYGKITTMNLLQMFSEGMRAHRCGPGEKGNFKILEEEDRYVMEFDPCGSGGRLRRHDELADLPPRTGEPFNLGVTKKGYDWSWGRKGVPYYCLHCCVWHEQMAIDKTGAPVKITEMPDDPSKPCRWLFYKRPEDIPEEYYTRIGRKKPDWKIK